MSQTVKFTRRTAVVAIVAGDLLLLAMGWFLLVGPERSTAQSIKRAATAAEVQIEQAKAPSSAMAPATQPKQPEIRTAYLYKLSKAMPTTTDMPNLLLELNQVVESSGVDLSSISPSLPDLTGTSTITLAVSGDFYSLTDLLYRLRSLVAVHNGALDVSGRLFSVKSVALTPAAGRTLEASITLNAYTFGASSTAATPGAVPTPTDTSTTATTTTTTTETTTSSPSADSAIEP